MKRIKKALALVLGAALLLALVPAAGAAGAKELRQAVVNQAKTIASVEWKLDARIARLNHSAEKTAAMHEVGVLPTTYFEFSRTHIPNVGVVMENISASYERFCSQLVDGSLPAAAGSIYYGMNQDAFLVDVVSRVSPTPITGVKQAVASDALTALLPGVDPAAASSAEAVNGADFAALTNAYSKLNLGDLLIAWNDNAKQGEQPKLSVMVVTGLEDYNVGQLTVTYPAFEQPTYYFTCDRCGAKSVEGPTSAILTKHIVSVSSRFSRFATHKEVDATASCGGTWIPNGASTWHTSEVSFEQLFGEGGVSVPGGGVCYVPYTLAAYGQDAPVEAQVKVTTDATVANIVAGFEAHIESNYRIVRVDAVLSQPGSEDKVFANYPEWTDWSYDYQNDALDLALAESDSGQYTLTLNVHTGPKTDPEMKESPVVKAYTLDLALNEPSLEIVAGATSIYQGQNVNIAVRSLEADVTEAELTMEYDPVYFAFDAEASRRANPNAVFATEVAGVVSVRCEDLAVGMGDTVAELSFRANRTGDISVDAKDIQPFAVGEAWIAKGGATQLDPVRVGGEQVRIGLDLNAAVYEDYAAGKDLLLVALLKTPAKVSYNGKVLTDVSPANYRFDGEAFTTVYGIVGENFDLSKITIEPYDSTAANVLPGLLYYNGDVNDCGVVDINDAQTIADIIGGKMPLEGNMIKWLRADMDRSGRIDTADIKALLQQIKG